MIKKNILMHMLLVVFVICCNQGMAAPIPKTFIKQFLPDNPIILEAGASDGRDTLAMALMWPFGKVYAFEPIPQWHQKTKEITKHLPNVKCFQEALSHKSGTAEFFLSNNSGMSSSLLKPAKHLEIFPSVKFEGVITVKTITIDEWAQREGIDSIDFIWLDMQGYEPIALMASPKILKTVKVVYSEISRKELYKEQVLYEDFKQFMQEAGFREIYEDTKGTHGNALFIRSNKNQVQLYEGK